MKLTIAIPTFNRNEILEKHIQFLLPQISEECTLLIIDNCSMVSVENTIGYLLSKYPLLNYKIIRNKVNIGGNANILRCVELCETEWLWILGDDDRPEPNAIKMILEDIALNESITHINYYCPHRIHPIRTNAVSTKGLDEYISNIDFFGSAIFISCNIYKVTDIIGNLGHAMFFQYSCASQFVILALSLNNGQKECLFSNRIIVKNESDNTPREALGSPLPVAFGLPSLMTLPIPSKSKLILKKKLVEAIKLLTRPEAVVYYLLLEWKRTNDAKDVRLKFSIMRKNVYSFHSNPLRNLLLYFYGLLLWFPGLFYNLILFAVDRKKDHLTESSTVRREI